HRHAPSRDIAHAFAQGNRIRHLVSGGLFVFNKMADSSAEDSGGQHTSRFVFARERSAWKSIGDGPQRLLQGRSTVNHYLGLNNKQSPCPGDSTPDQSKARRIAQTLTGQRIPSWSSKPGLYQTNKLLVIANGDSCAPNSFAIARDSQRPGNTFVGRIEEIVNRVDFDASEPAGVLVQKTVVNAARERYGMPSITLTGEWVVLGAKDLLCAVNVQHNCKDNHCSATAGVPVFQERTKTTQTAARVAHASNPQDIVLNTAKMRDAVYVQQYRIDSVSMNVERVITESAAKEIDARKETARAAPAPASAPRPSVRTRARPPSHVVEPSPAPSSSTGGA
ncbi:hypothetical protein R3P38DRAFT_2480447, partial [Favolaschia claudopus]